MVKVLTTRIVSVDRGEKNSIFVGAFLECATGLGGKRKCCNRNKDRENSIEE
jgi:hypothetical protein